MFEDKGFTMRNRWLDRLGFLGLSSVVFLWGYIQGYVLLSLHVEFAFIVIAFDYLQAVISTASFTAFIAVSGLLFLWKSMRSRKADGEVAGIDGSVAAIVPVYKDAAVLERSVHSLLDSTYDDLTVYIVCELDDSTSIAKARELASHDRVECLLNETARGSKAGAINEAVEATESDYVAVFDGDELVHPGFVASAIARLEDHDVVQGRTIPQPTGLIESLVYYESILLSYVARRLLYVFTGFRMAASRAIVMHRETLAELGGYDETMVTEDFDFAYRCYRNHVDVAEDLAHPSRIEAAHTPQDWWGQRKRWMTGYAQVLHRLLGNLRDWNSYRDLLSVAICASTVGGSLLLLSIVSKFFVLSLLDLKLFIAIPLTTVVSMTLAIRYYDVTRDLVADVGWSWALVPLVFPLYSLAAIKAMLEYLTSWDGGWYHVEKGS